MDVRGFGGVELSRARHSALTQQLGTSDGASVSSSSVAEGARACAAAIRRTGGHNHAWSNLQNARILACEFCVTTVLDPSIFFRVAVLLIAPSHAPIEIASPARFWVDKDHTETKPPFTRID